MKGTRDGFVAYLNPLKLPLRGNSTFIILFFMSTFLAYRVRRFHASAGKKGIKKIYFFYKLLPLQARTSFHLAEVLG